jgi:hypothetical protein
VRKIIKNCGTGALEPAKSTEEDIDVVHIPLPPAVESLSTEEGYEFVSPNVKHADVESGSATGCIVS